METNQQAAARSLSEEVTRLSDTIHACERLCLLTTRTVLRCAISLDQAAGKDAPLAFIPSVSRELQNVLPFSTPGARASTNPHPTTSAHCITALQNLLPVIGRFQLGTHESKGLAFHPIERDSLDVFKPKAVSDEIRRTIERGLDGLDWRPTEGVSQANDSASRQQRASQSTQAEAQRKCDPTTFPPLHPFRAAQALRAFAPSHAVFKPVAWRSLFSVVWFLNRRSGSPRGFPTIQATDSPGTAFLTSKCVEAIEMLLSVFERRRERFRRLFAMLSELKKIVTAQEELKKLEEDVISEPVFHHGYRYKTAVLIPEVRACIAELACDSALPDTYEGWKSGLGSLAGGTERPPESKSDLEKELTHAEYEKKFKSAERFLVEAVSTFRAAMRGEPPTGSRGDVFQDHAGTKNTTDEAVDAIEGIVDIVGRIYVAIKQERDSENKREHGSEQAPKRVTQEELYKLPRWICSEDYWDATKRALGVEGSQQLEDRDPAESQAILNTLEMHWARHRDAAENASNTVVAFATYLEQILKDLQKMERDLPTEPDLASVDRFLEVCGEATRHIETLRKQLTNDLDVGVRWAEVVMNRHLAYAASGAMAQFDPCELAHAVRVMSRDSGRVRFALILKALQVVTASQRADGTWSCQQPFYWRESGFALWTTSIETASAVVSTVHMLVTNPDRYGAGLAEVAAGVQPIYDALDRFFRWLSGSMQSFQAPPPLLTAAEFAHPKDEKTPDAAAPAAATIADQTTVSSGRAAKKKKRAEPPLYGWCSDRLSESDRIHSWTTAMAIEFLVDFRRLLQDRINAALRAEFLTHHPSELTRLSEVEPTDLRNVLRRGEEGPVIARLMKLLREHKKLELAEGPWVPGNPDEAKISFWSGLLYGPPGTSKTFLAKAIAGELGWPLISVSPSDFLARGDAQIESTAQEIFSAFSCGSRLVFFFDEIDELIRDRREHADHRSALSFLTPSFLAKLQEFRDAAERNEFIFLLATNYKDRIDSAAIRSGRIDQSFPVVYPDSRSRAYIVIRALAEKSKAKDVRDQFEHIGTYLRNAQACLEAFRPEGRSGKFLDGLAEYTGFLSYQKIRALLKLLPQKLSNQQECRKDLDQLLGSLSGIGKKDTGRYQPEISLAEYANRPDTFDDELRLLTEVIPHTDPIWGPSGGQTPPLLQAQLYELFKKIDDEKVRDAFKEFLKRVCEKKSLHLPWASS